MSTLTLALLRHAYAIETGAGLAVVILGGAAFILLRLWLNRWTEHALDTTPKEKAIARGTGRSPGAAAPVDETSPGNPGSPGSPGNPGIAEAPLPADPAAALRELERRKGT